MKKRKSLFKDSLLALYLDNTLELQGIIDVVINDWQKFEEIADKQGLDKSAIYEWMYNEET